MGGALTSAGRLDAAVSATVDQEPIAVTFWRCFELEIGKFHLNGAGGRPQTLHDVDTVDARGVRQRIIRAV